MRADQVVESQRLMAQSISALADLIENSTGFGLTPIAYVARPGAARTGMLACFTDSTVNTWGGVVAGGGSYTVLAFFNGTDWKVISA